MATLVCFHAHPDDEAIATGGVIAQASAAGHRVVLVVATDGALGLAPEDLGPGETTARRRTEELQASAEVLGVHRVESLGYRDSGMVGDPANDDPDCFWRADVDQAAERLAAILVEESADALTIYDDHGGYGHPDHIAVHRVGMAAAALAGTPRVLQATMNRDEVGRLLAAAAEAGLLGPDGGDGAAGSQGAEPAGDGGDGAASEAPAVASAADFGSPEAIITTAVDVRAWTGHKRRAMAAHRSQIGEGSWFLAMPDELFAVAFGTEWFIEPRTAPGTTWSTGLFEPPLAQRPT